MHLFTRTPKPVALSDMVLLVCPTWGLLHPPLGVAYLCESLAKAGLKTELFDINVLLFHELRKKGLDWVWTGQTRGRLTREEEAQLLFREGRKLIDSLVMRILDQGAPIIGFSLISERSWIFSLLLAEQLKRKDRKRTIVFGGNAADEFSRHINQTQFFARYRRWRDLQRKAVDLVVTGEGEMVLPRLVMNRIGKHPLVQGLEEYLSTGETNLVLQAPVIKDLDTIPYPTYRQFDFSQYGNFFGTNKNLPPDSRQFQFLFSRGCMNRCSFCNENLYSGPYRCRSASNAMEELNYLIENYGVTHLECNDLILNGNLKELLALCELISRKGLKIRWTGLFWLNPRLRRADFEMMFRAGLTAIHFGLESGSSRILDLMRKHYDANSAERVIRAAKEAGMWISVNIVIGFPGETEEDFELTLDFLRRNRSFIDAVMNLSTCEIDKGMELMRNPERFGLRSVEGDRWEDSVGNTYEARREKAERFRQFAGELELPIYIDNTELRW